MSIKHVATNIASLMIAMIGFAGLILTSIMFITSNESHTVAELIGVGLFTVMGYGMILLIAILLRNSVKRQKHKLNCTLSKITCCEDLNVFDDARLIDLTMLYTNNNNRCVFSIDKETVGNILHEELVNRGLVNGPEPIKYLFWGYKYTADHSILKFSSKFIYVDRPMPNYNNYIIFMHELNDIKVSNWYLFSKIRIYYANKFITFITYNNNVRQLILHDKEHASSI